MYRKDVACAMCIRKVCFNCNVRKLLFYFCAGESFVFGLVMDVRYEFQDFMIIERPQFGVSITKKIRTGVRVRC